MSLYERVLGEAKAGPTIQAVAGHIKWLLTRRKKMGLPARVPIGMDEFMSQYDSDGTLRQVQALLRSKAAEIGKITGLKHLHLEKGYTKASTYDPGSANITSMKGKTKGRHKVPAQIVWE